VEAVTELELVLHALMVFQKIAESVVQAFVAFLYKMALCHIKSVPNCDFCAYELLIQVAQGLGIPKCRTQFHRLLQPRKWVL